MPYKHCVTKLALSEKLPLADLEATAKEHEAAGMDSNAAMIRAVEDALKLAQMEEQSIIKAVRTQYEAKGGAPKPQTAIDKFNSMLIPDMSDSDLAEARAAYGDKHKRTAKIDKEIAKRAAQAAPAKVPELAPAAAPAPAASLRAAFEQAIETNAMPKDNPALRKMVEQFDGKPADQVRMKEAQEIMEAAIAQVARKVVAKNEGPRSTFDALLRLYESQPNLNIRTSTSIENQAYSTPAPLAFLASSLAHIGKADTVLEPTAGTGLLLIGATPRNVVANELEPFRAGLLREQGYTVTEQDASERIPTAKPVDAVITNPPFGSIKGADGKPAKVKVDGYALGQIDHLIAARALEAMKDDGRATLIIGANKVQGGISNNDLIFFNYLYSHYNVTSHFEVEGDLYQRQGAGWPVRVITINGRQASDKVSPAAGTIARANNWEEVYGQFSHAMDASREPVGTAETASVRDSAIEAKPELVSKPAGAKAVAPDATKPVSDATGVADVAGASAGTVATGERKPAEPVARADGAKRSDASPAVTDRLERAGPGVIEPARAAKPAGSGRTDGVKATGENQFQSSYVARSARKDEGVLIPVNMAAPTQNGLSKLEDQVGDIDAYAAKKLGYKNTDELHNALMGLQVDSVASAINQIEGGKGIIIADQTGIGKGRQAAAIIRWAAKAGHIPVFITVKPSLFTDMYGDLADIGTHDIAPFIMNSAESIKGQGDEKLFANKPSQHKRTISDIAATGELPEGSNAVFMTYSQINVANTQRAALMALAPRAVFVLDESHNAGGESSTGAFVQEVLGLAKGVTYLSATYAKRPDNMPLYFKTDIGDAVADSNTLMGAMEAGGLPLQTVVSNNLVKAGQMFRRERSYDGVSIETRADTARRKEHEGLSNETTQALRAIVAADKAFHNGFVAQQQKEAEKAGGRVLDIAGNQASASVNHTEFSSVVHNFVRQMLLGLKAQSAADEAIASLQRGEKPLIALENTMGSFLAEYAENNSLAAGDALGDFDYRTVLARALDRTRYITRQLPNGEKVKEYIPLSKLDDKTRQAYVSAQRTIDNLKLDIPVSPLDWMRSQIEKAGYSVAEITGRNLSVDYSNPKVPVLSSLDQAEQKDKVATTRRFNSGKLDAIILNVAGSTGISLHASERFEDQRQRHMIVAQAAQDINIFMQMLGRVHRTGQVRLPKYTILGVDLPAEKRPTAILSGKMKSLNANTSSNTESATSVKSADLLNKYGDQIVGQYLADNPELATALGIEDAMTEKGPLEDVARKATGRLALMPVETQLQFYEEVEAQYNDLLDYLNKTNQNELEPRTFDFDAKELKQAVLYEGPNPKTPFGEDAIYGEYSVKAQGKAMTPDEIAAAMKHNLEGKEAREHVQAIIKAGQADFEALTAKLADNPERQVAETNVARSTMDFMRSHPIGSAFRVEINGDIYNAVVTNLKSNHKGRGNPFSLSKIQMTVAVNGALRTLSVPATQFKRIEVTALGANLRNLFAVQPDNQREVAKIVTGNLLAAYGEISGARGTIISFTKQDGSSEQGILLPKQFEMSKNTSGDYRMRSGEDAYRFLMQGNDPNLARFGIATRDSVVRVTPTGSGITIEVPKSKARGGKYFLDDTLRAVVGDFISGGNVMRAVVPQAKAAEAIDTLMRKQALYAPASMAEEARSMLGGKDGTEQASVQSNISPTDTRIAAMVRDGTSVKALLSEITQTGSKDQQELARALLAQNLKTGILFETAKAGQQFTTEQANADNARGGYRASDNTAILYRADGATQTMLHELVHAATINALERGGLAAQQIKSMFNAVRALPNFKDEYGISNAEEFIAEAYTSPRFRQMLADTPAPGAKLSFWQKLMGIVRIILGKPAVADNMLDAVMRAGAGLMAENGNTTAEGGERASTGPAGERTIEVDGVRRSIYDSEGNLLSSDFNEQSEFWKWYGDGAVNDAGRPVVAGGQYTNGKGDVRPVIGNIRASIGDTLTRAAGDVAAVRLPANYLVGDLFNNTGKISWWHKTIGTMDNLARRHAVFKPVYDAVQNFIGDVSRYAVQAADVAPTLLPNLESVADIVGKNRKKAVSAADTKAIGAPIFEGTLTWARDANGKPVQIADLEEQAKGLTTEQKAQVLLQQGVIDDEQHQAWQGSPLDFYDSAISKKYAESQLRAGVVWTDAELRSQFNLNPYQIGLYHEFRNAIDKSLTNLSISEMVKMGGKEAKGLMDKAVNAGNLQDAAVLLRDHFRALAQANPDQTDMHLDTATQIMNLADKAQSLMDHGYAPLSRFGKYTVYVEKDGEQIYFGMFESKAEASMMARKMTAENPGANVLHGTVSEEAYKLFAGVSPETIELFGSMVGLDANTDQASTEVYQAYLKLAKNNRSAMKRLIQRKGIAGFSEDAGRVLAGFIYSNARLTSGNAHLGEIDEAAQKIPKQQGELMDAAMQLREHIRNPQQGTQLGGLMFAQFLGGSVASAMVNLTQPLTMTLPFLSQYGGVRKATARMVEAVKDAGKATTGDAGLDAALKWAADEGIVAPQEIHYLQAQAQGKASLISGDGTKMGDARALANNSMSKFSLGWGKLFAMAELSNRRITFIAAYRTAVQEGKPDPARFAEEAVSQTQGTYNSGNKSAWARNPVGGLLLTFKQYSVAYLELMTRMAFAGEPGSQERKSGQKAALLMVATLLLMSGADGLPFEQDLEDAIDGLMQRLGYNFSMKRSKQAFLTDVLGEGAAHFALKGVSAMPGMPIDVAGRFGMGNLIPGTGLLTKKEDHTRDLGELAGPAGDLAARAFSASGKLLGGDVAGAALDISPASIRNIAKGVDMLGTGAYHDTRGYKVNDVSPLEGVMKVIGFQPNSTAQVQDSKGQALNMLAQHRMRSKEITEQWAQAMAAGDAAGVQSARDAMHDWNEKNRDTPIKVSMPGIIKRVKAMKQDAINRTEKTAPKALKEAVKTELAGVQN